MAYKGKIPMLHVGLNALFILFLKCILPGFLEKQDGD